MGEFDTISEEHFRHLDAEGVLIIDGIASEEDAEAFRKAIRDVARQQGWKVITKYLPERARVWAVREDFEFQTDAHERHAADAVADLISKTREGGNE